MHSQPHKKLLPQSEQCYAVLVTNLDSLVTLKDVEYLFNAIGKITSIKMIREGVAKIIFLKKEDALSAIKIFHSRNFNGLKMNVTIVNKT